MDVHQQLLELKHENARLMKQTDKVDMVEQLRKENKSMRLEL